LCAVAEEGFSRFSQVMYDVRRKNRHRDGLSITRAMVKAYVNFARHNKAYYDQMYGSRSWHSGNPRPSLARVARNTLRAETERLKRGQERGLIADNVDIVRYAQMYWGTLHGISRLLLDGVYTDTASINKLCDTTAETLWQPLSPTHADEAENKK